MPLNRRLPKFGFKNNGRKELATINIASLNAFKEGSEVTEALLIESGLVKKAPYGIKVLGKGELSVKLTVKAHAFSESAKAAIEAKGGVAEVIA